MGKILKMSLTEGGQIAEEAIDGVIFPKWTRVKDSNITAQAYLSLERAAARRHQGGETGFLEEGLPELLIPAPGLKLELFCEEKIPAAKLAAALRAARLAQMEVEIFFRSEAAGDFLPLLDIAAPDDIYSQDQEDPL